MTLIRDSFHRLFPGQEFPYQTYLEYNRRLADFNANIRLQNNTIYLHLNLQWKDIDEEIKIGLIQSLLLKILKRKGHTSNIELYSNFIKSIPILTFKTKSDPVLEDSFQRVSQQFSVIFQGQLEKPNLQWGEVSFRKLAHYNFHNDTVTVSSTFQEASRAVLDYLMYHELLHKHYTFEQRNGRSAYHTREFREAERLYPQQKEMEGEINRWVKKKRIKPAFWRFW
ncbi:MAG: hypothetical protein AABX13_00910 [Nanoarchaeota archaeon]